MAYIISERVHFSQVNDEVVILDEASDSYLALNEVGATIWTAIGEGLDDQQIAVRIAERYDVEDERAETDVTEFLHTLLVRGLVASI